jgi:D-alanyl-D-alanine carboxypeptidase (penicillin-binding protein 5/6)
VRHRRLRRQASALGIASLAMLGALAAGGLSQVRAQGSTPPPAPTLEPPPPTPVVQPGGGVSPSPFPTSLHTAPPGGEPPEIRAAAAVLVDLDTGQVLFDVGGNHRRPIASLTKIMTALVVLERADPAAVVTVTEEAASGRVAGISSLGLLPEERIHVQQLLYALLLQSANDAALALAEHVGGTVEGFVELMNGRARALGMSRSRFASPNGLDEDGYSSARDLVRLTRRAFATPGFAEIVSARFHTIRSRDAEPRTVQNRNVLLWLYPGAIGVKTGFTSEAGFCVVAAAERDGRRLLAVVLGEPAEPFSDAASLLNYGFAGFERRELIRTGQPLGTVDLAGRAVAVAAGGSLEALVPMDRLVERTIVLDGRVPYPPAVGEAIGGVRVSAGGTDFGTVPLLVTGVPPPPPPEPGTWWGRAFAALVEAAGAVLEGILG